MEHDETLVKLYKLIFKNSGYRIVGFAKNSQEILEIYRTLEIKPNIVLMDYYLPVEYEFKNTRELIKIEKNLKIIVISSDPSIEKKALLAGAITFIEKPFTIQYIIDIIFQFY